MPPDRLVTPARTTPPKNEVGSPDGNTDSLYRAFRLLWGQLLHSAKRSLIIARQNAEQKFAARAASRKAEQRARQLANVRSFLIMFSPSFQKERDRLKTETDRESEELKTRTHTQEVQVRTGAEQERQQAEQARLLAEEETRRNAQEAREQAAAQARVKAERERQQAEQARLLAEEETRRNAQEAREQAAAQARVKAEREQAVLQTEEQLLGYSKKYCPKCEREFSPDQTYCLYDATRLASTPNAVTVRKPNATGTLVWILVVITFLGTVILGLFVINYTSSEPISAPSGEPKQAASVVQDPPVVGGTLKGKATTLPNPEFPERAKIEGASGKVTVAVLVDKTGTVIAARAVSGHLLLQVPAVEAARKAKFQFSTPGQRRRTSGTITYNFKL